MATIAANVRRIGGGLVRITYASALTEADDGEPVDITAYGPVKAVALGGSGTFGTGGTIQMDKSHDNTTFTPMADLAGTAISLIAAGYEQSQELSRYVRANISAGTGVSVNPVIDVFLGG